MSTLRFFLANHIKVKKIKLVIGSRCELCSREYALENLEIHTFLEKEVAAGHPPAYLERFLLVLCSRCHGELHTHAVSVPEQEALVQERPEPVREEIRAILAYMPKPYQPPEVDLEEAYREASEPRHFRYGG